MLAGAFAATTATVLAACGKPKLVELPGEFQGAGETGDAPPTVVIPEGAVSAGPQGPVSVNLGVATGNPLAAQLESQVHGAVADAKAVNENLDVNIVQISVGQGFQFQSNPDVFVQAVESALGENKSLDLLIVGSRAEMLALREASLLQPIDRFFSASSSSLDDYYPAAAGFGGFDGHTWALPMALVPTVFWYGEEQFQNAGVEPPPPEGWTWEEFQVAAGTLTISPDASSSGGQWGHYFTPSSPFSHSSSLILIWQNGGGLVAADGSRSLLAEPAAIDAVSLIEKMVHQDGVAPATDPELTQFGGGGGGGRRGFQLEVNGQSLSTMFGPATLPFGIGGLDQLGVRVSGMIRGREEATAATVPAAIAVMDGAGDAADAFFALREVSAKMETRMSFPARRTGVEEILALSDGLTWTEAEAILRGLETARVPVFDQSQQILQILANEVENPVISGTLSAAEACKNGAEVIDKLLAEE
jgi:ABC-type glycerol-3-phosphate transport system substrate-binding protein